MGGAHFERLFFYIFSPEIYPVEKRGKRFFDIS